MNNLTHIERAYRNTRVIGWWRSQSATFRLFARENYAAHLRCPLDETVDTMLDQADLDWLWTKYHAMIEAGTIN